MRKESTKARRTTSEPPSRKPSRGGTIRTGRSPARRSTARSRVPVCLVAQEVLPADLAVAILRARQSALAHRVRRLVRQRERHRLLPAAHLLEVGARDVLGGDDIRHKKKREKDGGKRKKKIYQAGCDLPRVYGLPDQP